MQNIITLGSPGSYGDQVRRRILPLSQAEYVKYHIDIIRKVVEEDGIWIVAVSNPYQGEVSDVWSTLDKYRQALVIAGSDILPLDHVVVQRTEDVWNQIETIISHPQAYGQSKVALDRLYPGHTHVHSDSTIESPSMIRKPSEAAICSKTGLAESEQASEFQVVQEKISPDKNATKFVVIATRESIWEIMNLPPSEVDILRVTLEDKPMQLASKLMTLGMMEANIHEWGKAKAIPGVSPLYSALLITSRLPRQVCNPAWFKHLGIEPITQKEDLW